MFRSGSGKRAVIIMQWKSEIRVRDYQRHHLLFGKSNSRRHPITICDNDMWPLKTINVN